MATRTATIKNLSVEIEVPYAAGHQLTEAEANVLNQTFVENIRNNTAKQVETMLAEGKSEDEARQTIRQYASEYSFANKRVGRIMDPVEREARRIAESAVMDQIRKLGKSKSDFDSDALARKIEEVSKADAVLKEANRIVRERQKTATQVDLSDIGAAPAEA